MDLPYYHGQLTKRECEMLLLSEGVDGNFLIRDSESVPGVLCLCVSQSAWQSLLTALEFFYSQLVRDFHQTVGFKNFVYTYRIFREKYGYYKIETAEGAPKQIFPNLKELISKYEKPDQGLVVHLSNPIKRNSFCPRWRSLQLQMSNVYENNDQEYVDVLP